jgi:selenide,water dikinase
LKGDVTFPVGMPEARRLLLADAQTSGGLLLSVPPNLVPDLLLLLNDTSPVAAVVGEIEKGRPGQIQVV